MATASSIRSVFSRELNRPIEKVITYQNQGQTQLKAEISEYVVTEHIADNFQRLLQLMQTAEQGGGGHEIGVWVSGFYGSGKSSYTKYFGFALDPNFKVGDDKFLDLLKNQIHTANATQVRALFNSVAATYDAQIIFLDLASEMLAGASLEDISTVLYLKVLQWAGYSEDLKVAELERMLERDGKLAEFEQRAAAELEGIPWKEVHNQPLVANPIAARLAAVFYPRLFPAHEAFQDIALDVMKSEVRRVEEMLGLIRRKSGKKRILFIVDEVGQYVSAKPNLILNLDGLAKNLKQLGGGQVWIFATAQQTLTEDSPSAMLNAPGLFKLKDRFPIQIQLEATDIEEICHKRLLTKSKAGEDALKALYDSFGPQLRTATQLKDAGVYEVPLDKTTFVNLYPFLPAHFKILIQLLIRLARKTGGLGLRSAIKVLQDVLVERGGRAASEPCLADAPVGTLANTVTFYDSLRRDLQSSFGYIVEGVKRVEDRFAAKPNRALAVNVAKSIAVLQILENLPVTAANIAALHQPRMDAPSLREDVAAVVDELLKDSLIPLGEKNGSLRFLTQAAVTLQKEFDQIEYRNADVRAEVNRALRALFKPLPSARLSNVRPVTAGVRVVFGGGQSAALEGEREPIQFLVEFVPPSAYDATRTQRENDSRAQSERKSIFLLGRTDSDAEQLAVTVLRCGRFLDAHRTASDPETQEYVRIVAERQERAARQLESKLRTSLQAGSFVAHGAHRPVSEVNPLDFGEACRGFLADTAARVFDRYSEAPVQADSGVAERFLKTPLDRVTSADDPLALITRAGGRAQIKLDHKALLSLKDYLGQVGQVEGRRLLDHFSEPPFGWSKDATRYLLAALFVASEIKLRIAGQDYSVKNDETLAALASNKALSVVGLSLRESRPDPAALLRASDRLRVLSGDEVHPLEDAVAAAAKKIFPALQQQSSSLAADLRHLALPGAERAESLASDLAEVVRGDGSAAALVLGAPDSPLCDSLQWARRVQQAFKNGLQQTIAALQVLRDTLTQLPASGVPGKLRQATTPRLTQVADILAKDGFYDEAAELGQARHVLDSQVASAVTDLTLGQSALLQSELQSLQTSPDWADLTPDDRQWVEATVERLPISVATDLSGLRALLAHAYDLHERLRTLGAEVAKRAAAARQARQQPPATPEGEPPVVPPVVDEKLYIPTSFASLDDIDRFIQMLANYRKRIEAGERVRLLSQVLSTEKPSFPSYD
ncbi:MAG: BREX system P-loop protein BrxC [Verrucomicrobiales bacterium]|nr:BREX system P-loop protein BrxC [Verrucomicrobiales bacterium]